ncbi:uncharacterized protein LOC117223196 [Megalopta genalis]|uniref:uncharacterized protein LOC117223196 n=1 Tax=Megalopta genalis TaxID=115081 RepID=UPI003FD1541C
MKEDINYNRRGIPDAWREYLASRGHCGATEARVLQKNLIPCYVRCLATDRLWNDLGLAFVQGIPDPWKDLFCLQGNACKKKSTPQIANNYDADDEAEMEDFVTSYCSSAKQHGGGTRDHPYMIQGESNLPSYDVKTFRTEEHISSDARGKQNKINQVTVGQSPKSPTSSIRVKNVGTIADGANKIQKERVRNKRVVVRGKSFAHGEKKLSAKTLNLTVTKPTVKERIETNLIEKTNQDVCVVQPKMMRNFTSCSCKLQNLIDSNVQRFPNCTSLLNEVNVLQHVLCKNCEDVYHGNNPRRPDPATNIINASGPIPKCCSRRQKIVEYGKMCKHTRLKLRGCIQKTKQQFDNFSCPRQLEGEDVIVNQDLKLVCCRCDCPYLRIASPNPIDRKTDSNDRQSCRMQNNRRIGPRERRRISKYVATRKHGSNCNDSENRSRTRAENKANVSRRDLQQALHSKAAKRSEASNKNVNNYTKSDAGSNNN